MKLSRILSLLPLFFVLIHCSSQPEVPLEEVRFHVSGMYCEGCVLAVTVELERLDEVRDVRVTLEDSLIVFTVPQNRIPTNQHLSEIIEELGYTALFDPTSTLP